MAEDVDRGLIFLARFPLKERERMRHIRHWSAVEAGQDAEWIWVRGLDAVQIEHVNLLSIPELRRFQGYNNKLHRYGSKLPEGPLPSLEWKTLKEFLPLKTGTLNHNYFGINQRMAMHMIETDYEQEECALLCQRNQLERYILDAPLVRMKGLAWCIIDAKTCVVQGAPILPLPGVILWQSGFHLIPAGYDLAPRSLKPVAANMLLGQKRGHILWTESGEYSLILNEAMVPLSRSSIRASSPDLQIVERHES